ncbi:hypothetical protein [Corynebacterium riegelii]|uniref:hypothetical protein n=1 Tax=Corynebacterium riegelii TaxID=156976 RepID=UPI002889F9B5|nr:hypothetical protein [Corynebacterium riegelii]
MSEQKQLTVAEILARAQKENPELGTRRRRRRSLEDGGVSVAELTGSIKKVEAKPAESRHSSVPIDAPAEKPAPPAAPAKPVDSEAPAAAPKVEPKVEKPEVKKVERASEDETAVIKKVPDAPAAPAPKAEAPKTEAPKPAPIVDLDAAPTKVEELEELDEFEDLEGTEDLEGAEDTEEAGVNPITLVLMVFLGVVLGILGFMLFKWLWTSTPTAVAAILGAITVAGSVYAARAIGTGRDWLSVGLAGVAAVVIAFGPALL